MDKILEQISKIGIVPVIKIDRVEDALPLAKALCEGGLPVAEVTFRTECAKDAIAVIAKELPEMIVGAGTVLTVQQVDEAIEAGSKFVVSPGLNPAIVKYCKQKGILIVPGCANPSDIECALELGLDVVKFFPAEAIGGIKAIKAMAAPYGQVKFMPTGGITPANVNDYLSFDKIFACGGSWMVNEQLIKDKAFDKITSLTEEAVMTMLGFELAHVGINAEGEEANKIAEQFAAFTGSTMKEGNSSIFTGTNGSVEVMKTPYLGAKGHIAYRTNYLGRAINYLEGKGFEFDQETAKFDDKGKMIAIYAKGEIGGFAVHLVEKR